MIYQRMTRAIVFGLVAFPVAAATAGDLGFVRVEAKIEQRRAIVTFNGAQIGRGLILTCAHCCQSAGGRGAPVTVQVLAEGTWKPHRTVTGKVWCYDPKADCGLIRLDDPDAIGTAYVLAPRGTKVETGQIVYALRWRRASQDMSALRGQITRVNPFLGPPTIETTTTPQPGESGGPLILAERRQIVGVTSALHLELQRGIYCGLEPIYDLLDECGQTALVEAMR